MTARLWDAVVCVNVFILWSRDTSFSICFVCGIVHAMVHVWKPEDSFHRRRFSPAVASGDPAWAVRPAHQALLSAELPCWPPAQLFKGSSVLWYFGFCSLQPEIYAPCFASSHLVSVHIDPLSSVSLFPWPYAMLTLIINFTPVYTKLCVPCGLSEKHCFSLSRILWDRPLIQRNKYLSQISSFFVI